MHKHQSARQGLEDLKTHREAYVTIGELADYWLVSRKQIYKQIDAGTLSAIRLGPRLLRIRTVDALDFENRAHMHPSSDSRSQAADPAAGTIPLRAQRHG